MPADQASRWCFTINNYTDDDIKKLSDVDLQIPSGRKGTASIKVTYMIFAKEVGEQGTPHLQGYVELKTRTTLARMKKLHETAHWECSKGSVQDNRDYITKQKDKEGYELFEWGNVSIQGKWSGVSEVFQAVDEGKFNREARLEMIRTQPKLYQQYRNVINEYETLAAPRRKWKTIVTILFGPGGTGKTKYAMDRGASMCFFSDKYFDSTDFKNENILIDDVEDNLISRQNMFHILDRYEHKVNIKGSSMNWAPKNVFITTNDPNPHMWYRKYGDSSAWQRRIDRWIHVPQPFVYHLMKPSENRESLEFIEDISEQVNEEAQTIEIL